MEIANKDVCVEFVDGGDNDSSGMPILRINIYHAGKKQWELVESFLTLIYAGTPVGVQSEFGMRILNKATPKLQRGESIKALAEKASHWGKSTHKYFEEVVV